MHDEAYPSHCQACDNGARAGGNEWPTPSAITMNTTSSPSRSTALRVAMAASQLSRASLRRARLCNSAVSLQTPSLHYGAGRRVLRAGSPFAATACQTARAEPRSRTAGGGAGHGREAVKGGERFRCLDHVRQYANAVMRPFRLASENFEPIARSSVARSQHGHDNSMTTQET
jgi:hypothetical protein